MLPSCPGWDWKRVERSGDIVDEIAACAEDFDADLLILTTEGRDGVFDVLRGSTTEQVLRRVPCPLLAVPSR